MEKRLFVFDLGNYNMKLTDTLCVRNDYRIVRDESISDYDIEIDGIKYFFGLDSKLNEDEDKIHRNQLPMILYGIYRTCSLKEVEAYLTLAVPNDEFPLRNLIIDKLKGREYTYTDNRGVRYKVRFKEVMVLREGYGAWRTIPPQNRREENIVLIDIGGKTANILASRQGYLIPEHVHTVRDCGMIKLYRDFAKAYAIQQQKRYIPKNDHLVIDLIKHRVIDLSVKPYSNILDEQVSRILEKVKGIPYLETYKIYLSGGGAETFLPKFMDEMKKDSVKILQDYLFANRNGAYRHSIQKEGWEEIR